MNYPIVFYIILMSNRFFYTKSVVCCKAITNEFNIKFKNKCIFINSKNTIIILNSQRKNFALCYHKILSIYYIIRTYGCFNTTF